MSHPLDHLDDLENYRRLFTDVEFFRPAVTEICRRHGLAPCETIRLGLPGTCPVFIVAERWLVKLYGRLFDGAASFAVEHAAAQLAGGHPAIPTPALLAAGQLEPPGASWAWPYLVFDFIPGVSLGEVRVQLSPTAQLSLARELGGWVRELHGIPLPAQGPFAPHWGAYLGLLAAQRAGCAARQAGWGELPARLVAQIEEYLLPAAELRLPEERPHLIHADLTEDHLLGRLEGGRWSTLALIDFGDAFSGSLFYELCALYFSLFARQKRLLAAFLEAYAYQGPAGADFTRRAMSCTLLHRFNVLDGLAQQAEIRDAASLEQVGEALWRID